MSKCIFSESDLPILPYNCFDVNPPDILIIANLVSPLYAPPRFKCHRKAVLMKAHCLSGAPFTRWSSGHSGGNNWYHHHRCSPHQRPRSRQWEAASCSLPPNPFSPPFSSSSVSPSPIPFLLLNIFPFYSFLFLLISSCFPRSSPQETSDSSCSVFLLIYWLNKVGVGVFLRNSEFKLAFEFWVAV